MANVKTDGVWLCRMYAFGSDLIVAGRTQEEAEKAMLAAYRRESESLQEQFGDDATNDFHTFEELQEYFGCSARLYDFGTVYWE